MHNIKIFDIAKEIIKFSDGYVHDIDHLLKVWSYARIIAMASNVDEETMYLIEVESLIHDIACPLCRKKYGDTDGKHQEIESDSLVRDFLGALNVEQKIIDRVSFVVSHHHTYSDIDGMDYQILIEADYIVNATENMYDTHNVSNFIQKLAKTDACIEILKSIFLI